ncbi:MAG: FlgD immunoglobulin-like domain containing protein [archaeon]
MKKTILSLFLIINNILLCQGTQWVNFSSANSLLPNNSIYAVAVDHQDLKWIGTDGYGLAKFDGTKWTTYTKTNSGISSNYIRTIYVDGENNKWIGTLDGGFCKFDGSSWTYWNMSNSILPSNWVTSIVIDRKGVKWIGTGDKGLVRIEGDKWTVYNSTNSPLPVNFVYALNADTLGNTWIGTNGGGLARFDGINWEIKNKYNSNLSCNASLSIAIDNKNDKWIASYTCGVFRLHDTTFTKFDKSVAPLHDNWVYCVTIDKQQAKWLGMDSTGIAKFSGDQWTIYDTANSGLADKHVRAIAIDNLGNKWIGTYLGGLSVFNENGVNIPPVIFVAQPANGINWIAGSKQKITWETSNVPGNVNIRLSTDGGSTFAVDLLLNTANDGSELITVPQIVSSSCVIRIESISNSQIKGITSGKFQIVAMSVPQQQKPANNSLRQPLSVKFNWNKGAWCSSYRLIIASDSTFLNPLVQDSSITDTVKEIKGLSEFRKYYWKVQGLNTGISTQWSPVWNFTTLLNAPDNLKASPEGKNKVMLSWGDKSQSEAGYVIERQSGIDFIVIKTIGANSTTFIDSGLAVPGNYQYRIKAIAIGGESDYSNIASASVTAVNDRASALGDFELAQNFPNPFNPATTIQYALSEQSDVRLTIYNSLGMIIKTFIFSSQSSGYQNVVWDGKDLNNEQTSSGIYLCKIRAITTDGKVKERVIKMMMLK